MIKAKWLGIGAALLPLCATGAWAVNPDVGPGCGLGKLAWSDYDHPKSIGPQVMMATTNGSFGSQTFGISSGTSGCTNDGTIFAEHWACPKKRCYCPPVHQVTGLEAADAAEGKIAIRS